MNKLELQEVYVRKNDWPTYAVVNMLNVKTVAHVGEPQSGYLLTKEQLKEFWDAARERHTVLGKYYDDFTNKFDDFVTPNK
jgi:hypothetical protein